MASPRATVSADDMRYRNKCTIINACGSKKAKRAAHCSLTKSVGFRMYTISMEKHFYSHTIALPFLQTEPLDVTVMQTRTNGKNKRILKNWVDGVCARGISKHIICILFGSSSSSSSFFCHIFRILHTALEWASEHTPYIYRSLV